MTTPSPPISNWSVQNLQSLASVADTMAILNPGCNEENRVKIQSALERVPRPQTRIEVPLIDSEKKHLKWCATVLDFLYLLHKNRQSKITLILCDDVEISEWPMHISKKDLPEDWSIIFMGGLHLQQPSSTDKLSKLVSPKDIHAIGAALINITRIKELRKELRELYHKSGWQSWFPNNISKCKGVYCIAPNLCWSNNINAPLSTQEKPHRIFSKRGNQLIEPNIINNLYSEILTGNNSPKAAIYQHQILINSRIKLGILFLTRNGLRHDHMWREFFEQSPKSANAFLYARERHKLDGEFSKSITPSLTAYTQWGHVSLVKAMLDLLRNGLQDTELTHFAFASESCIPIRPLSEIISSISIDPRSRINFSPPTRRARDWRRATYIPLIDYNLRVNAQWSLLSRQHAELLTSYDFTDAFLDTHAPDENYTATILGLLGVDLENEILKLDITWREFPKNYCSHPREWETIDQIFIREIRKQGAFFARKFSVNSNVHTLRPHI